FVRPIRITHPRGSTPAAEAIVQPLAADKPITKVVPPLGRDLLNRENFLVDSPGDLHAGVQARLRPTWEIGMLTKAARHRLIALVGAGQRHGKTSVVQAELLPCLIGPWPFARFLAVAKQCLAVVSSVDAPGVEPALPMEWTRVAGHVRLKLHLAPAEREGTAAYAVHVRDEREAGGLEHVFEATVAFPQYWAGGVTIAPLE